MAVAPVYITLKLRIAIKTIKPLKILFTEGLGAA